MLDPVLLHSDMAGRPDWISNVHVSSHGDMYGEVARRLDLLKSRVLLKKVDTNKQDGILRV